MSSPFSPLYPCGTLRLSLESGTAGEARSENHASRFESVRVMREGRRKVEGLRAGEVSRMWRGDGRAGAPVAREAGVGFGLDGREEAAQIAEDIRRLELVVNVLVR